MHFHIGASVTAMGFYGRYPWASHPPSTRLAIGGTLLFIGNARVVVNVILAGMFDRYPDLKMVSVESGCGWIPFILEALDYEMEENAPGDLAKLSRKPSEYFRSNLYATYWFERNQGKLPRAFRERSGEDSIMFATDFPHPTCLYPRPVERAQETMAALSPEVRGALAGQDAGDDPWPAVVRWLREHPGPNWPNVPSCSASPRPSAPRARATRCASPTTVRCWSAGSA